MSIKIDHLILYSRKSAHAGRVTADLFDILSVLGPFSTSCFVLLIFQQNIDFMKKRMFDLSETFIPFYYNLIKGGCQVNWD